MSLQVVGSGFGRTGTLSMKEALGMLDLDPCHRWKSWKIRHKATGLVCFDHRPDRVLCRETYALNRWMGRSAIACRPARRRDQPGVRQ